MRSRREFLQIGIALGAWPIAAAAAQAAGSAVEIGPTPLPLHRVLYDERFEESVEFGRRTEALGLPLQRINGDVTRFWYEHLYYRWREGPAAIAGMTAHGALFVLERLAWDQGMRVVFKAEHNPSAGRCIVHELSGPLTMVHASLGLTKPAQRWGVLMADVISQCPEGRSEIARTRLEAPTPFEHSLEDALYSWVIAPAARA